MSALTESFVTANADALGPNHSWTEVAPDWDIVTNAAEMVSEGGGMKTVRCDTALASVDHYIRATVVQVGDEWGLSVRFSSSANTFYSGQLQTAGNACRIQKVVAGSQTTLNTGTLTPSVGDIIELRVVGTTITLLQNGTTRCTTTNGDITTGTQVGLNAWQNDATHSRYGPIEAGDLTDGAEGDSYVYLGGAGSISTPDNALWTPAAAGDLDMRMDYSADDATPAALSTLLAHWKVGGDNRSWMWNLQPSGNFNYENGSADGSAWLENWANTPGAVDAGDGVRRQYRVTYVGDDGASGSTCDFAERENTDDLKDWLSWVDIGENGTNPHARTPTLKDVTELLYIGANNGGSGNFFTGRIYQMSLFVDGVLVADPDFRTETQTSDEGATFVDSFSNTWTLNGDAAWPAQPEATGGHGMAWKPRLRQGVEYPEWLMRKMRQSPSMAAALVHAWRRGTLKEPRE